MTPNATRKYGFSAEGLAGDEAAGELRLRLGGVEGVSDVSVEAKTGRIEFRVADDNGTGRRLERALRLIKAAGLTLPTAEAEIDIFDLRCAACVNTLEEGLKKIPGIVAARVNFATQTGRVEYIEGLYVRDRLPGDIRQIGYRADFHRDASEDNREAVRLRRNVALSIAAAAAVFALHFGEHVLRLFMLSPAISSFIQLLLTLPVLYAGRGFFVDALVQLRRLRANMNSLVALGSGTAFVYSLAVTGRILAGRAEFGAVVYYETTAMIITFILIGKFLEARATKEAREAAAAMASLIPRTVTRLRDDGEEEIIASGDLRPDDVVLIRPGQSIPADGVVIEGETAVDESMITGESMPVAKKPAVQVVGGTVNIDGGFKMRVLRVGQGTVLSGMIRMVRDAQAEKAPIQRMADRVAAVFVPIVLAVALLTLVVWAIADPGSRMVLIAPVAVLLVACPCALGLATPTAILVGTGRAARSGVLFRNGIILEKLSKVGCFIFDKTGTLTEGKPAVDEILPAEGTTAEQLLRLAAAAEQYSEHPYATAIRDRARRDGGKLPPAENRQYYPGRGVTAEIGGRQVVLGNRLFVAQAGLPEDQIAAMKAVEKDRGATVVMVAADRRYLGAFVMGDSLKNGAAELVGHLQALGHEVMMLTGDNKYAAVSMAGKLGIKRVEPEASPEKKLATIDSMRRTGCMTAMIGDGVNDAAALAAADIGIALGTGTDIAIKASDVTITGRSLRAIETAVHISRQTIRIIRQNLFWAFFYNVIMIPVAAGVLYPVFGITFSPVLAAAAMALSSVFVVTNSLRLRKVSLPSYAGEDR